MTKEEQAEAWANENGDVTKHYDWDISKNGFLAGWEACERSKSLKTNSSILTTPQATMTQEKKTETFDPAKILEEAKNAVSLKKHNHYFNMHFRRSTAEIIEIMDEAALLAIASVREEYEKKVRELRGIEYNQQSEIEQLTAYSAELKSLKQSLLESGLNTFMPQKNMTFHDKVVLGVGKLTEEIERLKAENEQLKKENERLKEKEIRGDSNE